MRSQFLNDGVLIMGDLQIKFIVLIVLVFLITAGFCALIWNQTKRFEKKALAAKQRQKEYEKELRLKMQAEKRAKKESQINKIE
jgi:hypothetical protein